METIYSICAMIFLISLLAGGVLSFQLFGATFSLLVTKINNWHDRKEQEYKKTKVQINLEQEIKNIKESYQAEMYNLEERIGELEEIICLEEQMVKNKVQQKVKQKREMAINA